MTEFFRGYTGFFNFLLRGQKLKTGRTLAGRFREETGISFGQWRQQIRILEALRRVGMHESVTAVAIELGYDSPSAFISMFKKALGKTPGQYFAV